MTGPLRLRRDHICWLLAMLLLTGCQRPAAFGLDDGLADAREACRQNDAQACRTLTQAALPTGAADERPTPERHAAQVQRDVAAIIRGMRQTSASNGL